MEIGTFMPFTLTMPKLSPTMEEGTIAKWRVKEGSFVKAGDVLLEVATDKATVEHTALDEGYLRKILVPEGKPVRVAEAIAIFTEKANESIEGYKPEGAAPPPPPPEQQKVQAAAPQAPAAAASPLQQPAFVPEPPLTGYRFEEAPLPEGRIAASPLARRLAKERGIDLSTIKGSGPGGRIVSSDIDKGMPEALVSFGAREVPTTAPGTYEEEALSPMRKIVGRRLQESKSFIPHFYLTIQIDAERLVALREELKTGGIKITFNDFMIRAAALALREHPAVNSGYNSVNSSLIRFKTIDIAVAVNIEGGLITPIIRHADYKNLGEISSEAKWLIKRAREGKLAREEYVGGSFTLSNLGMYGVSEFIAVINPPQAAILAIAGIQEQPVIREGQIVKGSTLALTLSADHRVIDGAEGAAFLLTLKKLLQNPSLLVV
jgi:pyruvate dehydrogenase E2 component (dihydrolipoamide acetyltransferase)